MGGGRAIAGRERPSGEQRRPIVTDRSLRTDYELQSLRAAPTVPAARLGESLRQMFVAGRAEGVTHVFGIMGELPALAALDRAHSLARVEGSLSAGLGGPRRRT
jgi:hypothetical protein